MGKPDLRELDDGDRVTITIRGGERLTATVIDPQHDPADEYGRGFWSAAFEGGLWGQVADRFDSEVLHLTQTFDRRTGEPGTPMASGTVERGGSLRRSTLGEVVDVEAAE